MEQFVDDDSFRDEYEPVKNLSSYAGSLLHIMRHDYDIQYLAAHPSLNELIGTIEAAKEVDWLNFYLGLEEKKLLFQRGAEKALDFLEQFDWEGHKALRRGNGTG